MILVCSLLIPVCVILNLLSLSSPCPRAYIDNATRKAFKVLGFIKRVSGEFKHSNSLKSIYWALVSTIDEYGLVVWDLQTADTSN